MKIAIVEDDINMRKSLELSLKDSGDFEIVSFKNAKDALKKLDDSIDLVITDINMPGMDGIEFLEKLDGKYEAIIMTGNATLNKAIESIRLGVKDFLTKPFEIDTLIKAIKRSQKIREVKESNKKGSGKPKEQIKEARANFKATSEVLDKAIKLSEKASKTDASILLLGESGVGKEVFANHIHETSNRADKPFIAINMAAIPEHLLESELFGYEKGAFTDATEARPGKFESANGGTIFLDEIGDMPMSLQAKLLRVLQEKEVVRLGSSKPIKIDVRVVSATNVNLQDRINNRDFREDLYFRLNTVPIEIPPLRERTGEIIDIGNWMLDQTVTKYNLGKKAFSKEAIDALIEYNWPGNIRELLSVVERAAILGESEEITKDDLFISSRVAKSDNINDLEKQFITEAMASVNFKVERAAELLDMKEETLIKKCKKYNIKMS